MTSDNLSEITTDPSLYPRLPDTPPPSGEVDAISRSAKHTKAGAVAGIVAAAALAVGIGVAVTTNGSSAAQTNGGAGAQQGGPGGFGGPGGARGGTGTGQGAQGPGGLGGQGGGAAQMTMATVTAVGTDSITVKTAAATTTYTVNASTQVVVDGAASKLSDITTGSSVLIQASGTSTVATRIISGFGGPGTGTGPGAGTGTGTGSGTIQGKTTTT